MLISVPDSDNEAPDFQTLCGLYLQRAPEFSAALPVLAKKLNSKEALFELCTLFDETENAAPGLSKFLSPQLGTLLNLLDVSGVRRWILTGLRLYPNHPAKLEAYFRLVDPAAARYMLAESQGISFERSRHSLELYLAGFGQYGIELRGRKEVSLNGPVLRPVISDAMLALPDHYLASDSGIRDDIYRAATAHALAHLQFSPRKQPAGKRKPLLLTMLSLIEDARVERLLVLQYPGLRSLWQHFHVASGAAGELDFASLSSRLARALHQSDYQDPNHWVNKGRELFEAAAHNLEDLAAFTEIASILANDLGQMRVRFNPQQYVVQPAYRDDHSFLWEYEGEPPDAPPEENMAQQSVQVEPSDTGSEKVIRISPIEVEAGSRWTYQEWDYKSEMLRDHWTTVIDKSEPDKEFRLLSGQERSKLQAVSLDTRARLLDRAVRLRRQSEGEELDLNAVIETRISQRAHLSPDPRIFQRPGKRRRHASILLLLDLSESTNDAVMGTFVSLLDIEKRAAMLLGESIDLNYDRLAIDGFCSEGREKVHYVRMKDFDEPFGPAQQKALSSRQGALSTRMGAALRHAGSRLAAEPTEKKILLLVTDGEPSDIDVTDQEYLIEDARHAVNKLAADGVTVFCLTLDRRADIYVKTIFGTWNYLIVDKAMTLPTQLRQTLSRLASR